MGDPGPIVYVDRSRVREGRLDELREAMAELADFVAANEPDIRSYDVYFDAEGERMTVVHTHADAASLAHHMAVAGPEFPPIAAFIEFEGIDVYGRPDDDLVEELRAKAEALGGGRVRIHDHHAGIAGALTG